MVEETFTQIIFPQLPKQIRVPLPNEQLRYDINNKPMNVTNNSTETYWLSVYTDRTEVMCTCPLCGEIYCYSTLKPDVDSNDLMMNIRALPTFFAQEFEWFCPQRNNHIDALKEKRGGYDIAYEEYADENWAIYNMR